MKVIDPRFIRAAVLCLLLCCANALPAQDTPVPHFIPHQGTLTGADATFTGTGRFKFILFSGTDPNVTAYWKNDTNTAPLITTGQTPGYGPAGSVSLPVTAGDYGLLLGSGATLPIPYVVFTHPSLRVRTWFSRTGTAGTFIQQPDTTIPAAPYAMQIPDGTITAGKIAPNAVTSAQIANGAVSLGKLGTGAITVGNLLTSGAAPANGQVLGFTNGTMAWTAPGAGAWSASGANVFRSTGNVGIGTSTPQTTLDIVSPQHALTMTASGPDVTFRDTANSNARSVIQSVAGDLSFFAESYMNGSNPYALLKLSNSGNVGIGSAQPAGKLEVVAQDALRLIGFQPFLTLYDSNSGYSRSRIQTANGGISLETESLVNGSNPFAILTLANNGNVGIGTSTPVGKLDVLAQDAIRIIGYQPFLTFYDGNSGYSRGRIQSAGGGISLEAESLCSGANPNNYATLGNDGSFSVKTLTIRGGADLAEPFQMKEEVLEKGSVVVIDNEHPGRLKRSRSAYDTRVAGIVSGANGVNPGIALRQEGVLEGGQNVALSGRVYVQADASNGPIEPGDLLTTSDTPGHAMKVTEPTRAQGAVIGKAMSSLEAGTGMVLVLVTLQ